MEETNNQNKNNALNEQNGLANDKKTFIDYKTTALYKKINDVIERINKKCLFNFEEEPKEDDFLKTQYIFTLGDYLKLLNSNPIDTSIFKADNSLMVITDNLNYKISYFVGILLKFFDEKYDDEYDRLVDICSYLANLKFLKVCLPCGGIKNDEE